ncbi:hypothetical protein [Metapseudomonas otitidis]|uniref:hypothetical protein n=1 Tax=Metapseudomonas otitidis TaxID=319939 RepID=UPI001F174922|nr:hypothetical protein [Pseudomonas otitidis]
MRDNQPYAETDAEETESTHEKQIKGFPVESAKKKLVFILADYMSLNPGLFYAANTTRRVLAVLFAYKNSGKWHKSNALNVGRKLHNNIRGNKTVFTDAKRV